MLFLSDEHRAFYLDFHGIPPEQADEMWQRKVAFHASKHQMPELIVDIQPWDAYQSPVTGECIDSRKKRREDLAKSNCRPYEGLQQEQAEARRAEQYREQKQDAKLFDTAARAFYAMPESKRRQLIRGM